MTKKKPDYGIKGYTKEQLEFHRDIMKVIKRKKHWKIPADDCMVVFGRVYSIYVATELVQEGKLKMVKKKK